MGEHFEDRGSKIRRRVVMVGPSTSAQGGIASVINELLLVGWGRGGRGVFIATHRDGSRWQKANLALMSWLRYLWMLICRDVTLLHVHAAAGASFWRKSLFVLPTLLARRPVVFQVHSGRFAAFVDHLHPIARRIAVQILLRSEVLLALTQESKKWLEERVGHSCVQLIFNPVRWNKESARNPADPPCVLFVGRLSEAKGVFDLLEAAKLLAAKGRTFEVLLCGTGAVDAVEARVIALGLGDRVRLMGWVDEAQRGRLLRRAAVFVLPSHAEQMPMALLEAMAARVPIVATKVGAIPEVVAHGVTGLLVPKQDVALLADAIDQTLKCPQECAAMAERAFAVIVERHDPSAILESLDTLYENCGR